MERKKIRLVLDMVEEQIKNLNANLVQLDELKYIVIDMLNNMPPDPQSAAEQGSVHASQPKRKTIKDSLSVAVHKVLRKAKEATGDTLTPNEIYQCLTEDGYKFRLNNPSSNINSINAAITRDHRLIRRDDGRIDFIE